VQSQSEERKPTGHETAVILRKKYTQRRAAIQRFTERLQKGVYPDDAELNTLRVVGVSEPEIRELVEKLAAS
jgi:hypothetical protein